MAINGSDDTSIMTQLSQNSNAKTEHKVLTVQFGNNVTISAPEDGNLTTEKYFEHRMLSFGVGV